MGLMTRLAILGLAGFGAWKLWEEYGPRVQDAMGEFSDRASTATRRAGDEFGKAADDFGKAADRATGAVKDAGTDIGRAAKDATADASSQFGRTGSTYR